MYYLFEFGGEFLIAREHTFKAYYEHKGAEIIRISYCFDELAQLSNNLN
jgi:hypothetical protein